MTYDCEEENLQNECAYKFELALERFIDEWRKKEHFQNYMLTFTFMTHAKLSACFDYDCYYHMLGELSDYLHTDLKRMFEDMQAVQKE